MFAGRMTIYVVRPAFFWVANIVFPRKITIFTLKPPNTISL